MAVPLSLALNAFWGRLVSTSWHISGSSSGKSSPWKVPLDFWGQLSPDTLKHCILLSRGRDRLPLGASIAAGGIPLTPVPNMGDKSAPPKSATVSPPLAEQLCPQPEAGGGEHLEAISLPIRLSFPWELAEDGKKEQKGAKRSVRCHRGWWGARGGLQGVLWGALAVPCPGVISTVPLLVLHRVPPLFPSPHFGAWQSGGVPTLGQASAFWLAARSQVRPLGIWGHCGDRAPVQVS